MRNTSEKQILAYNTAALSQANKLKHILEIHYIFFTKLHAMQIQVLKLCFVLLCFFLTIKHT